MTVISTNMGHDTWQQEAYKKYSNSVKNDERAQKHLKVVESEGRVFLVQVPRKHKFQSKIMKNIYKKETKNSTRVCRIVSELIPLGRRNPKI